MAAAARASIAASATSPPTPGRSSTTPVVGISGRNGKQAHIGEQNVSGVAADLPDAVAEEVIQPKLKGGGAADGGATEAVDKKLYKFMDEADQPVSIEGRAGECAVGHRPYPLWAVPIPEILTASTFRPHEELLQSGTLAVREGFGPQPNVVFVSHTWLGAEHPDPHGEKLRLLQGLLRGIVLKQGVRFTPDWVREMEGDDEPFTEAQLHHALGEGFVWFDFSSMPQRASEARTRAILSLPAYVQACGHFLCLVPTCMCEDGSFRDRSSWAKRGWCRLEALANSLSADPKRVLVAESPASLSIPAQTNAFRHPVGRGAFARSSDRERLGAVVGALVSARQSAAESAGDFIAFRYLEAVRGHMLAGLSPAGAGASEGSRTCSSRTSAGAELAEWLARLRFKAPDEEAESGWTPLRFAAYADLPRLARELLVGGAAVNSPLADPRPDLTHGRAVTILHGTAVLRDAPEVLRLLLDAAADPRHTTESGHTALALAAYGGCCVNIDTIMEKRPEAAAILHPMGCTPWDVAIMGDQREALLHFHRRYSAHVAEQPVIDAWGNCATMTAVAYTGNAEMVAAVLDMGSPVDQAQSPKTLVTKTLTRMSEAACYVRERPGELPELLANARGATPLLLACYLGQLAVARLLIERKASVQSRSAYGRSALALAAMRGHEEVVLALLDASVDSRAKDSWGRSPATWAERRGFQKLAEVIRSRMEPAQTRDSRHPALCFFGSTC